MSVENTKYDKEAKFLYDIHRRDKGIKEGWPNFHHLKRVERDRWRGLVQIAVEENLWDFNQIEKN